MKMFRIFPVALALAFAASLPARGQRLNPPPPLNDELTGRPIQGGTRNVVICIHGWNNPPVNDRYRDTPEWSWLVSQAWPVLQGSSSDPWALLLYHWEEDANTGFIDWSEPGYYWQVTGNANQAARNAWEHGISLGSRLPASLRRVHLIAHSAGAWCAYQVASALVANPYVVVQVTLLDPYIPNEVPGYRGDYPYLSDATFNGLANRPFSSRLFLLENYYADDALQWDSTQASGPTWGTQETFTWPGGNGVNLQVAWGPVVVPPPPKPAYLAFYDFHSGPTVFYGDTIKAANLGPGEAPPARLPPGYPPYTYQAYGWFSSLFQHVRIGALPRITSQPTRNTTVATGSSVTLTVQATSILPLSYQWLKRGQADPISGATGASYTFTASSTSAGDYVVCVSDSTGMIFSDFATVDLATGAPPPTTFNVAASSGPNGYISPSGSFSRNVGSSVTLTAAATSGYEIDRWYVNGLVAQTSGASYTIANLQANTSVQVTFRTTGTVVLTGSVLVNIAPAAAVFAGAQWRFAGGNYQPPGVPFQNLGPGQYQISFKPVSGYDTPDDQSVSVVANQQTAVNASYTSITPSTYTLTLNYDSSQGAASAWPPAAGGGYPANTVVQLSAATQFNHRFTGWSGDVSGGANPTTIVMNGNKSVTANFAPGDPSLGTLTVTIQPPAAAAAGVTWGFNANDFRGSGSSYTTFPATYILTIHPVEGWLGPYGVFATLTAGQTTNITVTFTPDPTPGFLTVTLSPPGVVSAGAKWHVNGGAAQGNGASLSLLPGSGYTVTFDSVPGWMAPPSQAVTVQRSQTTVVTGNYTPPVGQPSIVSIQPSVGGLAGGTLLTIQGFNFATPATVLVGGRTASNVTVLGTSQITCLTPSSSVYGTAPVVVQSSGGNATNLGGFAYGFPRGNGIQLAGSIGGYVKAVVAQANYCYMGEGTTFTVLDVSNPAAPTPIARLAMPGVIEDIALFTVSSRQYAALADGDAGLQVVDVTVPAAPALRGYYNTGDWANGIRIIENHAYVVSANSGLMTFDISSPTQPQLLSTLPTSGYADDLAVQASGTRVFAYVSSGGSLLAVDVSNPNSPSLGGQAALVGSTSHSVAISSNRVFVTDLVQYMQMFDISNPTNPVSLGQPTPGGETAVTSVGDYIYAECGFGGGYGLTVYKLNGGNLQTIGSISTGPIADWRRVAVSGGRAYCTGGTHGLYIYDVSTPSHPLYRGGVNATAGFYLSAGLSTSYAFLATQNNGLKVFDVNNPAAPNLQSQFVPGVGAGGAKVVVQGNRAFFLGYDGQIRILDVANPNQTPPLLGTTPSQFHVFDFYLLGNYIVAAGSGTDSTPAMAILNANNPASISIQGQIYLGAPFGPGAGSICGNTASALVAVPNPTGGGNSLQVINVSNLSAPQQTAQVPDIGVVNLRAMQLSLDSHYICVGGNQAWKVFDLNNGGSPILVSSNNVSFQVLGFDFTNTVAYVATWRSVLVYDFSNPSQPLLLRSYSTPSRAYDVKAAGKTLYVAGADGGFSILTLSDINPPEVFITMPTSASVYTNTTGTLNLSGTADDNLGLAQGIVAGVAWANSRGGGGNAPGTTNWTVSGIALLPGTNILTVTAFDATGNSSNVALTVFYQPPLESQTITFPAIADHTFGDPPIPLAAAASSGLAVNFSVTSGPASVSNNVLTLRGAGTVVVEANQSGSASFNAAVPVDVSFNVARANQYTAFDPVSDKSVGDAPFVLSATASSGLPVAFAIVSGPSTVVGNLVTLSGAGTVTVRASQSGDTNYNAAPDVDLSFAVAKLPQFITFGSLGRQVFGDAPFALAGIASSGLPVSFSVLSGPATVSGNMLTLAGPGLVVLRASQAGDGTYAPAPNADQVLMVAPGNNVVSDFHRLANGMFSLRFYGEAGTNCVVLASTNLMNWLPLITNQVGGLGYLEFTDFSATNYSRRFYRAVVP